jgi:hypothetical protein
MLDGHHASVCEDLLGEVVDQLAVDEAVDAVVDNVFHLHCHQGFGLGFQDTSTALEKKVEELTPGALIVQGRQITKVRVWKR